MYIFNKLALQFNIHIVRVCSLPHLILIISESPRPKERDRNRIVTCFSFLMGRGDQGIEWVKKRFSRIEGITDKRFANQLIIHPNFTISNYFIPMTRDLPCVLRL